MFGDKYTFAAVKSTYVRGPPRVPSGTVILFEAKELPDASKRYTVVVYELPEIYGNPIAVNLKDV